MILPDPPINVRLVMADGTEVPVDTVYRGEEGDSHAWEVVNPPKGRVRALKIDELPAHTLVRIAGRWEPQ